MSTDNVSPIRPEAEEKPRRARRKREPPPANTFDMPENVRLVYALEGICTALEDSWIGSGCDADMQHGLATAAAIVSRMVRESLTNQSII